MRGFLIYSLVVAIVQCRHESGYNYRPPNLGGIHGSGGNSGGSFSSSTGSFQQIGSISSAGSSSLGGSSFGGTSFGGTTGGGHFGHGGSGISSGGLIGSTGIGSAGYVSGSTGSAGLGQFGGSVSSGGGFVSGGSTGFAQGPALVQKHIYVHVPPPEPQESFPQRQVSVGVAQKHYKIIFIKAPSAPSLSQQQIALAGQNQEKTIVYVLVKKPDDIGDIAIPTIAPTQPSKPEVYFIKYKAQKQTSGTGAISTGGSSISGPGGLIGTTSIGSGTTIVGGGSHHHGGLSSTSSGIGGISSSAISSGSASSSVGGIPAAQYGPPGQSGPY